MSPAPPPPPGGAHAAHAASLPSTSTTEALLCAQAPLLATNLEICQWPAAALHAADHNGNGRLTP